ncbi:WD domain protein [Aspergillus fischeri NRRL 181]|uniref:WD domain protein n=1 Tax=Neosartorya fischeri (strain ATCC 1020 / DSM 3700 / CBS 544.65 / FGSC A1164 / JCM 1740 / NRRL 181 / WB 181) TaxID=331117 RepID=A1DJZ9_NEOFI|nr:WD domain protein [Aspergillus fischeri NRRL 181]EAW17038.1 WD domain protein [Aspergillus fischeri NRRL 181]KAG2000890.1 hypothetical protein GB937_010727 [Aspergillus fischeri]
MIHIPVDEEYTEQLRKFLLHEGVHHRLREVLVSDIARPSSVPMIIDSDLNDHREEGKVPDPINEIIADRDRWKGDFETEREKKESISSELRKITAERDKLQDELKKLKAKPPSETRKNEQWAPRFIIPGIEFSPDGKWLASRSYDKTMRIRDAGTSTQLIQFTTAYAYLSSTPFSPDGKSIAYPGSASLWDPMTGRERIRLQGSLVMSEPIAFSTNGRLVASGHSTAINVWDTSTGAQRQRLIKPGSEKNIETDTIKHIAFSPDPDSKILASASWWKTVTLWNTSTWTVQRILDVSAAYVHHVAFSPDSKLLATASIDGRIRLWEVVTGSERPSLQTRPSCVSYCVEFSPDGRFIAAGGNHEKVMVWDAKTGALKQELDGHRLGGNVSCLAFSRDSKSLAFGNSDGMLKVFQTS